MTDLKIHKDKGRWSKSGYDVAKGKQVWQQDKIQLASPDAIGVTVPSNVLTPGACTLTIENAEHATLGRLPLRLEC